ncbi:hypothetical protein Unana1_06600 [Umbelopsis nana]
MGNSHGRPKSKKSESQTDTKASFKSTDTTETTSQNSTLTPAHSSYLTAQDTKAKRSTHRPHRVSSLFESVSSGEADQRRKTKRILSPILPKKSKDAYDEVESPPSTTETPSVIETPINSENTLFFTQSEMLDDVIQRAIQAAAEATGSVGGDDPWLNPSTLPVNKPRQSQAVVNYNKLVDSGDSVVKQLYYMAENAGERKKEVDRYTRQHYLLKQIVGGIHKSPLNSPQDIIDLGCGTGVWCVEMAQKYPLAHIVGLALDPPSVSVPDSLKNLSFLKVDLFQPAAGIESLKSNSVDFIFIRDMAHAIATNERWMSIIRESYRVLRPDGWLEVTEPDWGLINPGPQFQKLIQLLEPVIQKAGLDPEYTDKLTTYQKDQKFVDCVEDVFHIPVGEWPLDPNEREIGYLFRDQVIRRYQAMKRWYVTLAGLSDEAFDNLWQVAMDENEPGTMKQWRICRGRKPTLTEAGTS